MKKILIITGNYYPKPSANGICSHQIALALKDNGHEVHILCYKKNSEKAEEIIDSIYVHRVNISMISRYKDSDVQSMYRKVMKKFAALVNRIRLLIYWPYYPLNSIKDVYKMYKNASRLHSKYSYSAVISVYNPLSSLIVGIVLKKLYGNFKYFPYFLDSITASWGHRFISKKDLEKKGWKWEKRVLRIADKAIAMKYHMKNHNNTRYDEFKEKLVYLDIPLFREIRLEGCVNSPFNITDINITYTGRLENDTYDPWYAISILKLIGLAKNNYKVHFYSRGSCEERLNQEMIDSNNHIERHGFVQVTEAIRAIHYSDILISFGTADSYMIPSKIFEYMSTGKPIIHFYKQDDDVCLPYFNKYPMSLVIRESYEDINDNALIVENFIRDKTGHTLNKADIINSFRENTPEYTADFIKNELNNEEDKHV